MIYTQRKRTPVHWGPVTDQSKSSAIAREGGVWEICRKCVDGERQLKGTPVPRETLPYQPNPCGPTSRPLSTATKSISTSQKSKTGASIYSRKHTCIKRRNVVPGVHHHQCPAEHSVLSFAYTYVLTAHLTPKLLAPFTRSEQYFKLRASSQYFRRFPSSVSQLTENFTLIYCYEFYIWNVWLA